ncbi:MAG: divergent polysaccharide deacetylase family protein [Rhizomicrobium sp.]
MRDAGTVAGLLLMGAVIAYCVVTFMGTPARTTMAGSAELALRSDARSTGPPTSPRTAPLTSHTDPAWLRAHARRGGASLFPLHGPVIAIVIDDLGNDVAGTRRAIALPKEVTLSFLPYPDTTAQLAREAIRAGHQILVHVPMQPVGTEDAGPMALRTDLPAEENVHRLDWALSRVPGFSGINNHMGSRFTADRDALLPVMTDIAARRVLFLDSRTTSNSQVVALAQSLGVTSAARDVFLDDEITSANVADELRIAEAHARQGGVSIAIGHPHPETLAALERWINDRNPRRVILVDVGDAIRLRAAHAALRSQITQ